MHEDDLIRKLYWVGQKRSNFEMRPFKNYTFVLLHMGLLPINSHLQYICPVCRFPFSNLNHWISHRSCHKTFGSTLLTPLFSCRECSTTFPSQDTYMKHQCLHRISKPIDAKRPPLISKRDISDLIGVDETARWCSATLGVFRTVL